MIVEACIAFLIHLPVDIGMYVKVAPTVTATREIAERDFGEQWGSILSPTCEKRYLVVVENPDGSRPVEIRLVIDGEDEPPPRPSPGASGWSLLPTWLSWWGSEE